MLKNALYSIALTLVLANAGCKKTNEDYPLERWDESVVFDPKDSVGNYARQFLMNIYATMPNNFAGIGSNALLDAGTDDAVYRYPNSTVETFVNGRWTAWNMPDNVWSKYYTGIRKVNTFLAKVDMVPVRTPGLVSEWKAEARFLRALFYFEMVKRWGGVPLVGDKIFTLEDNLDVPRNSYEECVAYIVAECDAIRELVVKDADLKDGDLGRITRGAVLALKARTLLYAASPLNNPANDVAKWQRAADAAKDVMNLGNFSLFSNFTTLFTTRKTTETILAFQSATSTGIETNYGPTGYSGNGTGNGLINPTQNLVDAFPMKNGKEISDPTSGYDPQKPYLNRDPRLAATVFYNGLSWLGRPVELYDGGRDYAGSQTGYFMRKFMGSFTTGSAYSATNHSSIIFRYAEVLLNYAEAANEASAAPPEDAFKAVESIRQRAGLVPYTISRSLSTTAFRELVRKERRLELAFEEHRFWDIRRWKIGASLLQSKTLTGVTVVKTPDNSYTYTYDRPVLNTVFEERMYRYPIPVGEIEKGKMLEQNTGWE